MGTHYEMVLACRLKPDVPQKVIETIEFLINKNYDEAYEYDYPDHPFFQLEEAVHLIPGMGAVAFAGKPDTTLFYDPTIRAYRLTIRTHMKEYLGDQEIKYFLNWLAKYCQPDEREYNFAGYVQYDDQPHPTLIYLGKDNNFYLVPFFSPKLV